MRKRKTDPTLIPEFVAAGLSDVEIAKRMGWTVGTLRVRCSQRRISLRRNIHLSQSILDQLHQRATSMGVSVSTLAASLLEVIAQDDLYDAVLDTDQAEMTSSNASVQ